MVAPPDVSLSLATSHSTADNDSTLLCQPYKARHDRKMISPFTSTNEEILISRER